MASKGSLEKMPVAATFAEAGDFQGAAEALRPGRKVLLAVRDDRIDEKVLNSALNLCKRMDAGLDILLVAPGDALPAPLEALLQKLQEEGVYYQLARQPGCRGRDIIRYANTHECISLVLVDSLDNWGDQAPGAGEKISDFWRKLACPLVVASAAAGGR